MAKKLKWNLILMSVLYLGLGIFLLMRPSTALNVVCYALGGVVLSDGLLLSAIRDPDPVMFFEPDRIYRSMKSDVVDDGVGLPLDVCFTLRPGRDLTVVAWGACIQEVMRAAALLAERGIVPAAAAGLSLGEYSALHAAGVFDADTAVELVAFRGKAMEKAAAGRPSAMTAVLETAALWEPRHG